MHQHLQQLLFGYNFFSIFVKMMPMRPVHLSFIIALFVAISCQKQMVDSIIVQDTLPLIVETKTDLFYDSYSVSQEDIEKYVRFVNLAYGKEARSIVPVPEEGETAFYIVNYESGWDLVCADKRGNVVLGESTEGEFSMDTDNVNMLSWVGTLIEEVLDLKKEEQIPEGLDEDAIEKIENNLKFWRLIIADPKLFKDAFPGTKTEIDPDELGYWELVSVDVDSTFYDAPPRLTSTHWHQYEPYNFYCPTINSFPYTNKAAGSVAVAGAQMAYFLHNSIGRPETAPGQAQAYLQNDGSWKWYLSNETSMVWPYMPADSLYNSYYSASMLITAIAYYIYTPFSLPETHYTNFLFTLEQLIDYFSSKGVSCSMKPYIEGYIGANLLDGIPVIMSAKQTRLSEQDRHCFIIDGYKRYDVTYTYTYVWHYDDGSLSNYDPDIVIDHVGLQVTQYCMNWGWGGAYDNSYYVSSAAAWSVGGTYYQYKGDIVQGFAIAE